MPIARINMRLPWGTTGVRGPLSSNTFHVDIGSDTLGPITGEALTDIFAPLYMVDTPVILGALISGPVEASVITMSDPTPRLPVFETTYTAEKGTTMLPGEVALNVSFRGDRVTGVPNQRHRGRVQLGPLDAGTVGADGLLTSAACTAVRDAFDDVNTALGVAGWTWVVGSNEFGFVPVTVAGIRNEAGTVRRRQLPASNYYSIT